MLYTHQQLFAKTRKEAPSDADAISHKLLTRAGYIDQLASGIFSLLPLGLLVEQKISNIIRQEMALLGALEVHLPSLQPTSIWQESGRLTTIDPPLFQTTDRHNKALVLGSTHEEVITTLARKNIESYQDLPISVFQIQTKFRNELRATGGLLRVREFFMKDLYSFHASQASLDEFYEQVKQAYTRIFHRCDLKAHIVKADSGTIGGAVSHEFSVEAVTGEDKVAVCQQCEFAANLEVFQAEEKVCPQCGGTLEIRACIENGHVFQLGTKYSALLGALFTNEQGEKQPVLMGCYGIGIGRLLASIVEIHHDDKGIIWPKEVAPINVHVIALQDSVQDSAREIAGKISEKMDVLLDVRNLSAGQKFAESDLLGLPTRIVVSEKTQAAGKLEVVNRQSGKKTMLDLNQFLTNASA